MAFHEVRFPTGISKGAAGGPERRTDVVTLASGFEERNSRWADSRRSFNAGYGVRAIDVSPSGDWSQVRVWFAGIGDLGIRANPTYGFIYPDSHPSLGFAANDTTPHIKRGPLVSADVVQLAMIEG